MSSFRRTHAPIGQWKLHSLEDRQVSYEIEVLKNEANLAVTNPCSFRERQVFYRSSIEVIFPVGGCIQKSSNGQKRGFATTRGSGHADVFPGFDGKIDVGSECYC